MPAMTLRLLIQATKMPLITIRPTAADLAIAKAVAAHTNPPEEVAEALTVGRAHSARPCRSHLAFIREEQAQGCPAAYGKRRHEHATLAHMG